MLNRNKKNKAGLVFLVFILFVLVILWKLPERLKAVEGSVSIDSANLNLATDNNSNGIINIGDVITIEVTLDNSDGGCEAAGTTVIADLQKYGGSSSVVLSCADNGGVGDFLSTELTVVDAAGNGIDVDSDDDASKVSILYSDSDDIPTSMETNALFEPVDTIAPAFEDVDSLQMLTQEGADPAIATNVWYYYEGDSFRMRVIAAAEADDEPLAEVKVCLAAVTDEEPEYECTSSDFDYDFEDYYYYYLPFSNVSGQTWELNEPVDSFPELGGYKMNLQLIDDAGNMTISASPAQMFVAAFGIDPKSFNEALNNDTTTDWSAITDFTNVSELVFSALEYDDDLAEYTDIEIGRLTVGNAENPINLADQDTITGLSNFGSNLTIGGEEMRIDSSALAALNLPAELRMRMDTADRPGLVVKDNLGAVREYVSNDASMNIDISYEEEICEGEGDEEVCDSEEHSLTLGGFSWSGDLQTLIFTTTGFSEFETDNDPPTVSALDAESGDYVIFSGGGPVGINFSERLSAAGKTAVENAISAGANYEPASYEWSDDSGLNISPNAEFDITFDNDVIADVVDAVGNTASNLLIIDSEFDEGEQEGGTDVDVDDDGDEIVILDDDAVNGITIPEGVDDVTINVDNLVTDGEGTLPEIVINAATSVGDVTVSIPNGVVVNGGTAWMGIINSPTVKANDSVSGVDGTVDSVLEIGFGSTELTFDKGVRIVIEGKAGKRIGYSHGGPFTEITAVCTDDSQAIGNALAAGADCKIDVGSDLVVWTKHFSSFVTFTTTITSSSTGGGGGGGGFLIQRQQEPFTPPDGGFRILIDDDTQYTNSLTVTLKLFGGLDAEKMVISNLPNFLHASQETYIPTKDWNICQGLASCPEGVYTVYAKFYAPLGKTSETVSDGIIYKKGITASHKFNVNLRYGQRGDDVRFLQIFLKDQGSGIYPEGIISGWFGSLTRKAVIRFQEKYASEILAVWGLIKGTGFVGRTTRSKINEILSQ